MKLIPILLLLVFIGGLATPQTAKPAMDCTISFQARVFVQWGPDAIPPNKKFYVLLNESHFYLMDADPEALLKAVALPNPELQSYDGTNERRPAGLGIYLVALEESKSGGFRGGNSHLRGFYEKASKIVNPHILEGIVTDREGKAKFAPVPAGTYFLVGSAAPPRAMGWNIRLEVNKPTLHVILDGKNQMGVQ